MSETEYKTDVIFTDSETGLKLELRHSGDAIISIPASARTKAEIASLFNGTVTYLQKQQAKLHKELEMRQLERLKERENRL